ncbi:MAG: hypothetical protein ACOC90_11510 [Bacteroidota bacterium]
MTQIHFSENKLNISNPNYFIGILLIFSSIALAILLFMFVPENIKQSQRLLDSLSAVRALGPDLTATCFYVIVFWLFAFFCAVKAVGKFGKGCRLVISHYIPPGVPADIEDVNSFEALLKKRTIKTFENPSPLLLKAVSFFSERFRFLTRIPARHAEDTMSAFSFWTVMLPLLIIPFILMPLLEEHLNLAVKFNWSVPYMLIVVIIAGLVIRFFSMLTLTSVKPATEVYEDSISISNSGNPMTFFNFVEKHFERWREGNFQNRNYIIQEPNCGKIEPGVTNNCRSSFLVETQPLPLNRNANMAPVLLGLGAIGLGTLGFLIIFQITTKGAFGHSVGFIIANFPLTATSFLAGLIAISMANKFYRAAQDMCNRYLFKSHVVSLELDTSYTSSKIGYGDGRGSQLYGNRPRIQSQTFIKVLSATIISESEGLRGRRVIVSSTTPEDLVQRTKELQADILTYEDTEGTLPGVDLTGKGFQTMAQANILLTSEMAAAQKKGDSKETHFNNEKVLPGINKLQQGESDANQDESGPELKPDEMECPFCCEVIKKRAVICRFCNRTLDNENPENPENRDREH